MRTARGICPSCALRAPVNADHRLAELLRVPMAAALLITTRSTRTESGTAVEHTIRHARGDLTVFSVELNDAKNVLMGQ